MKRGDSIYTTIWESCFLNGTPILMKERYAHLITSFFLLFWANFYTNANADFASEIAVECGVSLPRKSKILRRNQLKLFLFEGQTLQNFAHRFLASHGTIVSLLLKVVLPKFRQKRAANGCFTYILRSKFMKTYHVQIIFVYLLILSFN